MPTGVSGHFYARKLKQASTFCLRRKTDLLENLLQMMIGESLARHVLLALGVDQLVPQGAQSHVGALVTRHQHTHEHRQATTHHDNVVVINYCTILAFFYLKTISTGFFL